MRLFAGGKWIQKSSFFIVGAIFGRKKIVIFAVAIGRRPVAAVPGVGKSAAAGGTGAGRRGAEKGRKR